MQSNSSNYQIPDQHNFESSQHSDIAVGNIHDSQAVAVGTHITQYVYLDGKPAPPDDADESQQVSGPPPYKGMTYYDVADADLFFGRESLTQELVAYLEDHAFLAIIGASGSGKSSVARAGLIPALLDGQPMENHPEWAVHIITPTEQPLEALAISLTRDSESVTATMTLMDDLAQDRRSLNVYIKRLLSRPNAPKRLLLLVDQFEELFTRCRDKETRRLFVENLLEAAGIINDPTSHRPTLFDSLANATDNTTDSHAPQPPAPVRIILTLRADFYAHCAEFAELRLALARYQNYIGIMNREEIRQVIERPAGETWQLESGLAEQILTDIGYGTRQEPEPGSLPLLSHALRETWERRRGATMTLAGYRAIGGVQGAIAQTAETLLADLSDDEQRMVRTIFRRLTEVGNENQYTRRRVLQQELLSGKGDHDAMQSILKRLADHRLVTISTVDLSIDSLSELPSEKAVKIEVAHEALLREWPTLRGWLDEDREGIRLHQRLGEDAKEWQGSGDDGMLYRGGRLELARAWAKENPDELSAVESAFLQASHDAVEAAICAEEEQREAERKARQEAEKRERRALAEQLAGQAQLLLYRDQMVGELPLILARDAVLITWLNDGYIAANAYSALNHAVQRAAWRQTLYSAGKHHEGSVNSVAYSPDGQTIASGGDDNTIHIWDAYTFEPISILFGHTDSVLSVEYSPDSTRIVSGSHDNTIRIWDAQIGRQLVIIDSHTDSVSSAKYSPSGTCIVSGSLDSTVCIWDARTATQLTQLDGHSGGVLSVEYSPDGTHIVSGGDDCTIRVWNVETETQLVLLDSHKGWVSSVGYSPDSTHIISGSLDNTACIWNAETGFQTALLGHTDWVNSVRYSPDGTRVVSSSSDSIVRIWDAETGRQLAKLDGHTGAVWTVGYSYDGTRIVSGCSDDTVRIWDDKKDARLMLFGTHKDAVTSVGYSPNGKCIVFGSLDHTVHIWDAEARSQLAKLDGHTGVIWAVGYSPNGTRIASGSADNTVRIWDAETGSQLFKLDGHTDDVRAVGYSPDGTCIVSGSSDHTVRIWDAQTGFQIAKLDGHTDTVWSVGYSPDDTHIVSSGSDHTARIWDARTGTQLYQLDGHKGVVWSVGYSPDGTCIVSGSSDHTVRIWDAQTGTQLYQL
ncbi:MAG: WD40 repeat domain-containing protein, partial [Chloroflexota bacterium]